MHLDGVLPPCIILKAKTSSKDGLMVFQETGAMKLVKMDGLQMKSDFGGFKNILFQWQQAVHSRTLGTYRLLVLDGHGSHLTPQFDQVCAENSIIPICTPPHSSHLLQPLDIGCFAVLKRTYGRLVEDQMRARINHIDKFDFLAAYPNARETSKPRTFKIALQLLV